MFDLLALGGSMVAVALSVVNFLRCRRIEKKLPPATVHNWNITTTPDAASFTSKKSAVQIERMIAARERNITIT